MKYLVLFLLMISFVSASQVDFNCPNSVFVNEEFSCSLEITEGKGIYDVKIEIQSDGKTIAKIWDDNKESWGSAYYYSKEFIEFGENKNIELKIEKNGDFEVVLKIRQANKVESWNFEIEVIENGVIEEDAEEDEKKVIREENNVKKNISSEVVSLNKEMEIISLNSFDGDNKEPNLIYESKNKRNLDYLPYAFSLLLLFILILLLWE